MKLLTWLTQRMQRKVTLKRKDGTTQQVNTNNITINKSIKLIDGTIFLLQEGVYKEQ